MYTFVPLIKAERELEIKSYESIGVGFNDKNQYKLLETIRIYDIDGCEWPLEFEVRVSFRDVRFYIIKNDSCIYLSINEIYNLLYDMNLNSDEDITDKLVAFYSNKEEYEFIYSENAYKFPKSPSFEDKYKVQIPYSDLYISYTELFILIFLIQEKSNYYWSISDKEVTYINGIIYLMITLLKSNQENNFLKKLGWNYSSDDNKFKDNVLSYPDKNEVSDVEYKKKRSIVDRKYYLTEEEMKSILNV